MDGAALEVQQPALPKHDDEVGPPSPEALIAGTLALMTAWADPCPLAHLPQDQLRKLLARKVVSNLLLLQHHPLVTPRLRQSIAQARQHWVGLAREAPAQLDATSPTAPPKLHMH